MRPVRRLLLLALIWGWSFLFIKVAVEGMPPAVVAWGRITLGALVLHAVLRRQRLRLPADRATWRRFAVTALFSNVLPFTLLAWGEQHISSALTSVLNASTPLFTAVLAAVVLGERLRSISVAGLLVGAVGVAVASGLGGADVASSSLSGAGAAIGAALSYGIAWVYMSQHLTGMRPLVAAAGQLTAGSAIVAPLALVTGLADGVSPSPTRLGSLALLGVFGTGIAYVLNYQVLAKMGVTRLSLVTYAIPIVGVAVGVLVLGEDLVVRQVIGGVLIVGGIAAANAQRRVDVTAEVGAPTTEPATA
jgi:drug/metabolite transporter (DMT)-like permease